MPGGDDFGSRPINFHVNGLADMGTNFVTRHGFIEGTVETTADRRRLVGTRIVLDYPSHTTTDNLMMAATLAKGTTVIENAAREPEVCDLADYLNAMGSSVQGAGTSRLEIKGVDALGPGVAHGHPGPGRDRHLLAAAGHRRRRGRGGGRPVRPHGDVRQQVAAPWGCEVDQRPEGLWAGAPSRLTSVDVATLPYPGVATDYKPLLVAMLSVADGVAIVTENLFEGRFRYVDELRRMGADIRTEGHHAVVRGVRRLSGRAGPCTRHPGRGRAGAGRSGRRRRDGGDRARGTSTGATRTSARSCASLGADVERR